MKINQQIFMLAMFSRTSIKITLGMTTKACRGHGSNLKQTQEIINQLPNIFKQHGVHSILDLPCGDYNWMKHVDLSDINYIGGDIVPKLLIKTINNMQAIQLVL